MREKMNEFDRLIREIPNLSSSGSNKFRKLKVWLGTILGYSPEDVEVKYVSTQKQYTNRVGEGLRHDPRFILVLVGQLPLDYAASRLGSKVAKSVDAAAVASESNGQWQIRRVFERHPSVSVSRAFQEIFPDLRVYPVAELTADPAAPLRESLPFAPKVAPIPIVVNPRTDRMVRLAVASSAAVLLVGPPGTGKSTLLRSIIQAVQERPQLYGFTTAPKESRWVTPDESWTTREILGGETIDEAGHLVFRPGYVLESIRADQWLVMDEANRADLDKIFGGLLTWLAGQEVQVGRASNRLDAPLVELGWAEASRCVVEELSSLEGGQGNAPVRFLAGSEWRLLGTYNALDAHRVFRFGHALGRRFWRVPVPPLEPEEFRRALEPLVSDLDDIVSRVLAELYDAHFETPGALLGPAIFLGAVAYVRKGLNIPQMQPNLQASNKVDEVVRLLSEAYLISAGVWLAKLEPSELQALGRRVVDNEILPDSEWSWIVKMLPSLG